MFTNTHKYLIAQTGSLLLEMMLTLGIGMLILSLLLEMYLTSQRSYHLQATLSELQNNANMAMTILSADIHQAGYIGCSPLTTDFPVSTHLPFTFTIDTALLGTMHELTVKHATFPNTMLTTAMTDDSTLYTTNNLKFSAGDILIIADCNQADIFQAAKVGTHRGAQKIISLTPLQHRYANDAEVSHFAINKYTIEKTARINANGTPIYSLFIQDINGRHSELVENISAMRITYSMMNQGVLIESTVAPINAQSQVLGVAIDLDLAVNTLKKTCHLYARAGE